MSGAGPATAALPRRRGCWLCDRASASDAVMGGLGSMAPAWSCGLFGEDRMAWGRDGSLGEPAATAFAAPFAMPSAMLSAAAPGPTGG